jgi:hypothetical protein
LQAGANVQLMSSINPQAPTLGTGAVSQLARCPPLILLLGFASNATASESTSPSTPLVEALLRYTFTDQLTGFASDIKRNIARKKIAGRLAKHLQTVRQRLRNSTRALS